MVRNILLLVAKTTTKTKTKIIGLRFKMSRLKKDEKQIKQKLRQGERNKWKIIYSEKNENEISAPQVN